MTTETTSQPFLTPREVSHQLRVSYMTVLRLIERGDIAAIRVGDQFRITPAELGDYLVRAQVR